MKRPPRAATSSRKDSNAFAAGQNRFSNSSSMTARRGCIAGGGTCRSWKNILPSATRFSSSASSSKPSRARWTIPETEVIEGGEEGFIHINRIAPVYPLTEGLPQRWLRGFIWRTLERFESRITEPAFGVPPSGGREPAKAGTPNRPSRANAIRMIHFPEELTDVEIARRRLALDEFIALQSADAASSEKFRSQVARPALRRRQSPDETVSGAPRIQAHWRANEGAARNPRGHERRASDATIAARRRRIRQNRGGGLHGVDGAGKRFQRRR